MRLIPSFLLFVPPLLAACSSASSESSAPSWADAPASIDTYEGRVVAVPLAIRASNPAAVRVTASGDGLEIEVTPTELRVRAAYGASPATMRVELAEGSQTTIVDVAVRAHRLSWKPIAWPTGQGPQPLEHGVFFVDESAGAAYLLHGSGYNPQWVPVAETWRFDLASNTWSSWTPAGPVPEPFAAGRGATVRGKNVAYVHGGYTGDPRTDERSLDELYRVDLGTGAFTQLTSSGGPGPRQLHAAAYDEQTDRLVVFGGIGSGLYGDTWIATFDGGAPTWSPVSAKGPSARYGAFYALDAESRRFVVWSGAQAPSASDPINAAQDAWALDLDSLSWSKLAPAGEAPPGRRNGCVMHDHVGRRLFVFGGTSDGRTSEKGLFVLDLEPGREAWTKLDLPGQPPERSSGFGFSTNDGRVACGFGNDQEAYADLNWLGYFD